ncbi:MAG: OsmC family protein [Chloroflexi bacterium]|nr:OsmC family protein [Chloroflexota bacterium]
MVQVSRVSEALHLQVDSAKAKVNGTFSRRGSILAGTAKSGMEEVEVVLEIHSPAPREQVAQLIRMAEATCFTIQALRNPVESKLVVFLNGEPLPSAF